MNKKTDELLKNGYFHMAPISKYGKIKSKGIEPAIGTNSIKDSEKVERFYFSQGIDGVYETISRFLKAYEIENGANNGVVFEKLEDYLNEQVYFLLDLEEKDFDKSDERNEYRRDMHSKQGVTLSPEKVNVLAVGSSIKAIDFLKYAYANYKNTYLKRENMQFIENEDIAKYVDLLNEFMEERVTDQDREKKLHISPILGQKELETKDNECEEIEL